MRAARTSSARQECVPGRAARVEARLRSVLPVARPEARPIRAPTAVRAADAAEGVVMLVFEKLRECRPEERRGLQQQEHDVILEHRSNHSLRSAVSGSACAARRAGTSAAATAAVRKRPATENTTTRSTGWTP